jgi:predicted nucleic acid-binding protein
MSKKKKVKPKKDNFVLDASIALAWCFADEADPYADSVGRKLPRVGAIVPSIWHLEIANGLLVGERGGRCDRGDTSRWTAFLSSLAISVDELQGSVAFGEILSLARAQNLSIYDATYVELALRRGLPLATLDGVLKAAAAAVSVELFDPLA